MKISVLKLFVIIFSVTLYSCSTQPEPIKYGEDSCHYCGMTIVSQAHSAQAVSAKGKQFKYDAIECMVNDIIENQSEMAVKHVANFANPGEMIDAEKAGYVINDSINSPMGANLAAMKIENNSPNLISWEKLKAQFQGKEPVTVNIP